MKLPLCVLLLAALPAVCAPPDNGDVVFTIATRGGRSTFRKGEAIEIQFQFEALAGSRYRIWPTATSRNVRLSQFDHFTAEPAANVRDPLADIPAQSEGGFIRGVPPTPQILDSGATSSRYLNDWISFRQAGRYRITAETTRVETLTLRSNTLEIEIKDPDPGWAGSQLQQSVAILESSPPAAPDEIARAGRTLRFLETQEAVPALARFFEHGPQEAQIDVRAGLFASPWRKEAISALEENVAAPDFAVSYYYLATLMELAMSTRMGPSPIYKDDPEAHFRYLASAKPIEQEYFARLAAAIAGKKGQALAVSLETLVTRGPQPAPPAILAGLVAAFPALPEGSQYTLLTVEWPQIADPSLEPVIRSLASGTASLRDIALLRLYDLNPDAGRAIALDRVRRGDIERGPFANPRVLLMLPDKRLPELDDVLAGALEQGKPVELLIARYATEAVYPRIRGALTARPALFCTPLIAYLYAVDPSYADERQEQSCSVSLAPYEDLLMSEGLERAAIDKLRSPDPMARRMAQSILQFARSPAAEQALWDGMARLKDSKAAFETGMLEYGYVEALTHGLGWMLTAADYDRLASLCTGENCRTGLQSSRKYLAEPIRITLAAMPADAFVSIAPAILMRSRDQFSAKIAQFPKGTRFQMERGYEGTWFRTHRVQQIRQILKDSGMQLIE